MAEVKIGKALDVGNDVLEVTGTVDERPAVARGWMSAMANYYDADDYGKDGHLKKSAKPRPMTKKERQAYCESLLLEQVAGEGGRPVEPKEVTL